MKYRFILLVFLPLVLSAQYYHKTDFGLQSGLPESDINDILQTKDGYLWILGQSTLTKYDGKNFSHVAFPEATNPTKMIEGPDGEIEFCDFSNLYSYKNGKIQIFRIDTAITHSEISALDINWHSVFDVFGNRWVFKPTLFCLNRNGTFVGKDKNGFPNDSLVFRELNGKVRYERIGLDNMGRCWVQLKNGFCYFDGEKWNSVKTGNYQDGIAGVYADKQGRFWIQYRKSPFIEIQNGVLKNDIDFKKYFDFESNGFISLSEDRQGNLFFLRSNILLKLSKNGKTEKQLFQQSYARVVFDSLGTVVLIADDHFAILKNNAEKKIADFGYYFGTVPDLLIDRENNYWFLVQRKLQQFSLINIGYRSFDDFKYVNCTEENFKSRGIFPMLTYVDKKGRVYFRSVVFS